MTLLVVPGQEIQAGKLTVGDGAFYDVEQDCVRAARLGKLVKDASGLLQVHTLTPKCTRIPQVGDVILGRCTRITQRFAGIDIDALLYTTDLTSPCYIPLVTPLKGTIRQQDIYAVEELETAQVPQCFRPGDVVRAKVIGRGDASAGLLLSTGLDVSLGVVQATSASSSGVPMQVLSWNEMLDPVTGLKEKRKCAKPEK